VEAKPIAAIAIGDGFRKGSTHPTGYSSAVYVLHVFQKKSKRGKQTSQRDVDLIRERLKRAGEVHKLKVTENEQ
jgi:hypothetical protein